MTHARQARRQSHRHQPNLEKLEDRCLLSFNEFPTLTGSAGPLEITTGPDGNLWFTEASGNKIGQMTLDGILAAEYTIPTSNSPLGITLGPDGNIWFTEYGASKIGQYINDTGNTVPALVGVLPPAQPAHTLPSDSHPTRTVVDAAFAQASVPWQPAGDSPAPVTADGVPSHLLSSHPPDPPGLDGTIRLDWEDAWAMR